MSNKDFKNDLIGLLYDNGVIISEEEANNILIMLLAKGYTIDKEIDDTCPYYAVSSIQVSSALHPFQRITKKIARCMGTKEMDECSCEGHKSKCGRHKELMY